MIQVCGNKSKDQSHYKISLSTPGSTPWLQ